MPISALRGPLIRRIVGLILIVLGVGLVVSALVWLLRGGAEETGSPIHADVNAWVPLRGAPDFGIPISGNERVVIPKIAVDEVVREGIDDATLARGPGHFPETAHPGQVGNCAITAHGAAGPTFGAPFERLVELDVGDAVLLYDAQGRSYRYVVTESKIIADTDFSVLDPTPNATVTLITCVVPSRVTHKRRVVIGVLKS